MLELGMKGTEGAAAPAPGEARDVLPRALREAGADVDVIAAYENVPSEENRDKVMEALEAGTLDCVTFGSSSTVRNFLASIPLDELKKHPGVHFAAIGPVTAETMRSLGLEPDIQSESFTIPAMVDAVCAGLCAQGAAHDPQARHSLASGSGTNAQAMIDAAEAGRLDADIRIIIANRPGAPVLDRAERHGIAHLCLDHKTFPRPRNLRQTHGGGTYCRRRGHRGSCGLHAPRPRPCFSDAFPGRVLNIHPAVLPAFPGTHGARDAWQYGAKFSGCTVHIVDPVMDGGAHHRSGHASPCVRTKTTKRCSIAFTCSSTASTCRLCSGWPKTVCASTAAACSLSRRAVRRLRSPELALIWPAAGRRFSNAFLPEPPAHIARRCRAHTADLQPREIA